MKCKFSIHIKQRQIRNVSAYLLRKCYLNESSQSRRPMIVVNNKNIILLLLSRKCLDLVWRWDWLLLLVIDMYSSIYGSYIGRILSFTIINLVEGSGEGGIKGWGRGRRSYYGRGGGGIIVFGYQSYSKYYWLWLLVAKLCEKHYCLLILFTDWPITDRYWYRLLILVIDIVYIGTGYWYWLLEAIEGATSSVTGCRN